jgi:mannose-1-phosphate guanylyltransferase/mannose-6-phosphate isomerase
MNPSKPEVPLVPLILSGGAGTRLWPVSRRAHPKPFMQLADGQSLAEKTWLRARQVAGNAPIITVTSRDYYFYTRDLYESLGAEPAQAQFLLEPAGRNTAPAIAMAALYVRAQLGGDACLMVMPADHLVNDTEAFAEAVCTAHGLATSGYLVTFGMHPTHPETGFGYIHQGEALDAEQAFKVAAFVEKPAHETALRYLAEGGYHWNSGMFCFTADTLLGAMRTYAPDVLEAAEAVWAQVQASDSPVELPAAAFEKCPSISIDYAVMERADNCAVVVSDFGWSDIGSWKAISELYQSDAAGNRIRGKAVMIDSRNCFVQGGKRLVAAVGIDNLVIVDTGDAVLVADRESARDVGQVVRELSRLEDESAVFHQTVHRPWGSYTVLEDAEDCKVKRLVVKPGQVLSLQLHHRRSEHWTVVQGVAKVRLGDEEFLLRQNQSTYIPVETMHRLENPGHEDVHLIEVQTGDYFGEDDIERFEDIYGRS